MTEGNIEVWENPKAFRRQISLAAMQVAALAPGELAMALAYELEPYSKIPAAGADVAWRRLPDANDGIATFEVAVAKRRARAAAQGGNLTKLKFAVAAIAAAACIAIAADWRLLQAKRAALAREIAVRQPLDSRLRALEAKRDSLAAETRNLRESRRRRAASQQRVARLRQALPAALDAIASVCGGKTLVREVKSPAPFTLEIGGMATTASGAMETMAKLGEALAAKGWLFTPGEIAAGDGAATTAFSCTMHLDTEGGDGL